jgi:hypothetical protein
MKPKFKPQYHHKKKRINSDVTISILIILVIILCWIKQAVLVFVFVSFWWGWGLNSRLHTCKVNPFSLETTHFALVILERDSPTLFAMVGIEP